jgi:hypothetical protein
MLTDLQLQASLSGELSAWTVQQSLRLLERVGLLTRSPPRIAINKTHLWSERRLSLTTPGRAVTRYTQNPANPQAASGTGESWQTAHASD